MRVIVLGGDGYLGWPTAMSLAASGHEVMAVDNFLRRDVVAQTDSYALVDTPHLSDRIKTFKRLHKEEIYFREVDCCDYHALSNVFLDFKPDAVVHYAELPSAPYSMLGYKEANKTFTNNLQATFNLIWAVKELAPSCHIVKLGTMGEYGTPNIDIEEGWIDIEHKGRSDRFLYPRQAGSLYHTTKVLDTDLLWFYVRMFGLIATDLMQGPVYGLSTPEADLDKNLMPNFHYDDIFGTVVNRFLVQAIAGVPLTVYGQGEQKRGYLNLLDTLQCVSLALSKPPEAGQLRILNQFTQILSVNEIADNVQQAGHELDLNVQIQNIQNPRKEKTSHYYNPANSNLLELGLKPHFMSKSALAGMLIQLLPFKNNIVKGNILPRVKWS